MKRIPLLILGLVCLLSASVTAHATYAQDNSSIDPFLGNWEGTGELFGTEATYSMTWERVLGERFVRLTFQNSMRNGESFTSVLEAEAYYSISTDGSVEATWFDTRGMILPIRGAIVGGVLTSDWGTPETEEGRTIYTLVDKNRIDVEDFVKRSGSYELFGRASYDRVNSDQNR